MIVFQAFSWTIKLDLGFKPSNAMACSQFILDLVIFYFITPRSSLFSSLPFYFLLLPRMKGVKRKDQSYRGGDGKEPIMWKQRRNQSYFRELRFSQATAVYPAAFILKPAEKKYIS